MAKKQIDALLWRSYMTSTSDALWGQRTNQYYIDFPKSDYEEFFGQYCVKEVDGDGNDVFSITLEPFEGKPSAGEYEVKFKKLRSGTERAGSWNMNGQFRDRAYDLWQQNRGPLKPYAAMDSDERANNYIVIFRDVDGRFHGRWIQAPDFALLPERLRRILLESKAGWSKL